MTLRLSDEAALVAVNIARYEADGSDDALICLRMEVEALWAKVRADTQEAFDRYRAEAAEEFHLSLSADREEGRRLGIVRSVE